MENLAKALRDLQASLNDVRGEQFSFSEVQIIGRMFEDMERIVPAWARTADKFVMARTQAEQPAEEVSIDA